MSVGTNIKQLRDRAGMTQEELADKLGVARSTVTQWENGWSNPRMGMVQKLAGVFNVTSADIVSERSSHIPFGSMPDGFIRVSPTSAWVPVQVKGRTHAGERMDEDESDYEVEFPVGVVSRHPGCFALKVEGDCMNRRYPDGCLVLVDPRMEPSNGRAVVAEFEDGRSVLRCYYRGQSSLMLTADSFTEYEDILLTGNDPVRLIGVVVWFQAEREEGE